MATVPGTDEERTFSLNWSVDAIERTWVAGPNLTTVGVVVTSSALRVIVATGVVVETIFAGLFPTESVISAFPGE